MAVFRVEKTKDFTIMCNHHLRNTELSLKAKGLLSLMLSLPEDWDYTTKGLFNLAISCYHSLYKRSLRFLRNANYAIKNETAPKACFFSYFINCKFLNTTKLVNVLLKFNAILTYAPNSLTD